MASESTRPCFSPFQAQAELELLQLVLNDSDTPYPWNPTDPNSYAYFEQLEQEVVAAGWLADELVPYTQALSSQIDQLWTTLAAPVPAPPAARLFNLDLFQQFANRMPQNLLETIVRRAQQAVAAQGILADQLVMCVQEILPEWGEDDLHVLARPFAYAMRSGAETELLDGALQSVRCEEWAELSSIEQARLSLAIARYAIAQLPKQE